MLSPLKTEKQISLHEEYSGKPCDLVLLDEYYRLLRGYRLCHFLEKKKKARGLRKQQILCPKSDHGIVSIARIARRGKEN
jgi:hypothetical protein